MRALQERGLCIPLNATYETYYDVFLTALLTQLVESSEKARKPVSIILDGASYLLKSQYAKGFVLRLTDHGSVWRSACGVHN